MANLTEKHLRWYLLSWTCIFINKETLTQVFSCHLCKIFKSIFFYRTPPVAASSNFETSGFTGAAMQMSFWISHDPVHLNIFSPSWHFRICFWKAQAFRSISIAPSHLKYSFLFSKMTRKGIVDTLVSQFPFPQTSIVITTE